MYITVARILALAPQASAALAPGLAEQLEDDMAAFGITTMLARAHFMAQACWESDHFRRLEENLNYSAERLAEVWPRLAPRAHELAFQPQRLANAAYAHRNGNRDEASGDGWTFRGRGLFQVTGRGNYTAVGYLGNPDDIATAVGAVHSALTFWRSRGCSEAANHDDCSAVTRLINGPAMDGLDRRRDLTEAAKHIFL